MLEENYPKISFFEKDNFMNYYVDLLGKLGNTYNPEKEKARRNFRNTLKEDLKNTRLEFFRRNFNKNLQKQLNEVVYMYEFYTKTVIDEKEFAELNSIFGKKYCMNLKFEHKPNYELLRSLFIKVFKSNNYELDYIYDWNLVAKFKKEYMKKE
jgi:hypothetical protein